jgi:hypothetical protein
MTKYFTNFTPQKHGFHFDNEFINQVFDIKIASWHTKGLCGGMAFSALDYYFAGKPIPTHIGSDFPNGKTPPEGSALYGYIYNRFMDTLQINNWSNALRFGLWTEKGDTDNWFWGDGIVKLTKTQELPKLFNSIQSGKPVALGLIGATDLTHIGDNHQVVAYGYEFDPTTGTVKIYIYDNNNPDAVTTLTSNVNDMASHFKSTYSPYDWRGFFVEDYVASYPPYTDICISKNLSASALYLRVGEPLTAKFTAKNVGQYTAHLQSLGIGMTIPNNNIQNILGKDNINTDLQPGQEREMTTMTDCFGSYLGKYGLYPVFYSNLTNLVVPWTLITQTPAPIVVPTSPLVVDAEWLSDSIMNPPPYVGQVQILKALPNQKPTAFGQFDETSNMDCQRSIILYNAQWTYNSATNQRQLNITNNYSITPSRTTYIFIRFCSSFDVFSTIMKDNTLLLQLTGNTPDNMLTNIPITLTKGNDYFGDYYWGSFKPSNNWTTQYQMKLMIQGSDAKAHYKNRNPIGDVLDSNPATIATVNTNSPTAYPFTGYEPGLDYNHKITIAPVTKSLNPDANEPNDTMQQAIPLQLPLPTAQSNNWLASTASVSKSQLNLGKEEDVDWFSIQYQSPATDDKYSSNKTTQQALSTIMGIRIVSVPPTLAIGCYITKGNCPAIDVYNSAGKLVQSIAQGSVIVIYNPTTTFPDKKLYAKISNPDFAGQGAFPYDLGVSYVTQHVDVTGFSMLNISAIDIRGVLLRRYFAAINLPDPPDDSIIDHSLPVSQPAFTVQNIQSLIKTTESFLQDPNNQAAFKSIINTDATTAIASDLANLARVSKSYGLNSDAERQFQSSANLYAQSKNTIAQTAVLKELNTLITLKRKQVITK